MEGSPYRKFSFSRRKGAVPGTGHGVLRSGDSGRLLAGTRSLPLIARFRHRTRGITCALKSTGVVHSQQASLRQDITPVILLSLVSLRPEPHSEFGGGPIPLYQTRRRVWKLVRVLLEVPDGVLDPLGFPFLASGITHADSRLNLEILFPYMEEIR
ncbi:hypothetical protein F2Q70_00017647 [Brassica cretica]|uniref:Uncharacterized protein n=1 Tax=Brassica cretica TaxID=69181 RepID=A0A8S9HSI1_BRACR|nr:hypothetical protein F2Q70_00017647 [Brassica cretica]KAF2600684.1 hypothetical protein F2Q68_00010583 [Brassica cretica]